ncbi:hypothetical protein QE152_g13589 [Popillia japonica]|uniref:DUF4806 domain-containing protein n=1 Tax=Popillia japonica TaxID=7064 RepID=A0AAW1LE84_POPJA
MISLMVFIPQHAEIVCELVMGFGMITSAAVSTRRHSELVTTHSKSVMSMPVLGKEELIQLLERNSSPQQSTTSEGAGAIEREAAADNTTQKILLYVKSIHQRLQKLENSKSSEQLPFDEIEKYLPVTDVESLRLFDEKLADKEFSTLFRGYLSTVGGRNFRDCICRMLKRIMSNGLGVQCSWLGYRNNIRISDRPFIKIVKEVILRAYHVSESDIDSVASEWLRLSKLRLSREKSSAV